MCKRLLIFCLLLGFAQGVLAQQAKSPYAGQQERAIKALSVVEIEQYLSGAGMGLAQAAELHHFPGPKHVLELADEIGLTEQQRRKTEDLYADMHQQAVAIGQKIVDQEAWLDRRFQSGEVSTEEIDSITEQIGSLQGTLRATHLRAHVQMKELLSDQQLSQYDHLRGYSEGQTHQHHPSH